MDIRLENLGLLFLLATILAVVIRRFHLPYTIGLVIVGVMLAFTPIVPDINLSKELIFSLFLPPLIFEAAIQIPLRKFYRDLLPILTLAFIGTLISTVIVAAGLHWLAGWEWVIAITIGAILSATDPVSVISTFKEAGVHGRLSRLVECESLMNDGVVAVLFAVLLAVLVGESVTPVAMLGSFFNMIIGGVVLGLIVAVAAIWVGGRSDDALVEIVLTSIAAYGSFLLAEHAHTSGVLAALTCGLIIGNWGSIGAQDDIGHDRVVSFWEMVAFVANAMIFLLIGLRLPFRVLHSEDGSMLLLYALLTLLLLMGRAVSVYGCSALFLRSSHKIPMPHQHILFWGGLRGALGLALVLGLPENIAHRDLLVSCVFVTVAFSIIVQGITIPPLLKKLGITES